MLFNSLQYVVFLPCVVAAYYALPHRVRWVLLLAASYYFYMCWKAEYAVLIAASTLVDYLAGLGLGRATRPGVRRALLGFSLATNLGLLFAFKYFNFVADSVRAALEAANIFVDVPMFHALLPVGISFYTFQTLSYTIDVYRGIQPPEKHPGLFAVYVAFFPQLVAGPIERPERLLPQFHQPHAFDPAALAEGVQRIIWGFFKKLVIADRLAVYVDEVFSHPGAHHGAAVWLAAYFFAIQVYCDFSGYSDIAVGSARLMGFRLMENFRQPYLAPSIAEFWHRWHISLSTWFRDYVYIPLGGSRVAPVRLHVNLAVVFVVSGLWHGANWTFVIWGALHALYYMASGWTAPVRERLARRTGLARVPRLHHALRVLVTFHLVAFAYVFFRAHTLRDALVLLRGLFEPGGAVRIALRPVDLVVAVAAVAALFVVEVTTQRREGERDRPPFATAPVGPRWAFYYAAAMATFICARFSANPFIYFQF